MNDCIVIIPTYNEIENIESIIRSVLSQHKPFHILIVDDNSPDRTADRVRLLQTEFSGRLFLENREKKGIRDCLCSWVQVGIRE
jgi:dolichol-phosphate mannosyltransferase